MQVKKGSTNVEVTIRIIDSTTGLPETAVEYDTAGIDLWYRRNGAVAVDITEAALAALTTAHTDGGIEHMGDGYYRLDVPDAAFAAGADKVMIGGTVTGMVVIGQEVHLVDYDPFDSVRMGMTALPDAAADAAGGLAISDAGGLDLDTLLSRITADVATEAKQDITAGYLDTEIAAIKAVTDVLPDSGALTSIAQASELVKVPKSDGTATWNATALASMEAEAVDALEAMHLDHLLAVEYDPASKPGVATALFNELIENDGGVSRFTANALEQLLAVVSSGISLSVQNLLERTYQMTNNKMTVDESTGAVALRNIGDTLDIATGSVVSSSGTTTRAQLF